VADVPSGLSLTLPEKLKKKKRGVKVMEERKKEALVMIE
jgi:hypothetical protein